nr:hypothetical protein [Saccharopolyspora erythraea]
MRVHLSEDTILHPDLREITDHYDDYGVMKSPLSDFQLALDQRPGIRAHYVHKGQPCALPPPDRPSS